MSSEDKKTILIIDDEEDIRDTLQFLLDKKGYHTVTAVDGEDGLEKLKGITPDLIILDMNMPRMNGLSFYNEVSNDGRSPYPILILTARANMEQFFKDLDVDGFMSKPFDNDELVDSIERIVKKNSRVLSLGSGGSKKRARRVCIVEDDFELFPQIALSFLEAGYVVNSAHSAASAMKRICMDMPDLMLISLSLRDVSGDVAIMKMKRLEETKNIKFILYSVENADRVRVTKKISEKEGIAKFVEYGVPEDLLNSADDLFEE